MNKILTRRAKEYFEVLDGLRLEGYVTNEQWQSLSIQEQTNAPRMTSRTIEDALLEHSYSKGSPSEQKKYRLLWMKERGIASELSGNTQARDLESDPIFGAVSAIRKQLNDEANLLIEEAAKKADEKVAEINTKYSNLQTQLANLQGKYNELAVLHDELKNKAKSVESDLLQIIKDKARAEATLKSEQEGFLKDRGQFESDIAELKDKHNSLVKSHEKYIESLHAQYKGEISLIKEYSERQRHSHIAEIDNLKVAKSKLEKELDKTKDTEQKLTHTNIDLARQLKRQEEETKHFQKENVTLVTDLRNNDKVFAETKGELKQLQISLSNQKEDYQNANKQLLDYKERVGRLEEQLQQAKTELANIIATKREK